jgi:Fe-S-cluster containining protein
LITASVATKYPYFAFLREAFETTDSYIMKALEQRRTEGKPMPVCKEGCYYCCLRNSVPLTELEFRGISWYVGEMLAEPERSAVREQLLHCGETTRCPFLVHEGCAIYPMRPLACRNFYILRRACAPDEDPWTNRRGDVLFVREGSQRAAAKILQGLEHGTFRECKTLAAAGMLVKISKPMEECYLPGLVAVMDHFGPPVGP